MKSGIFHNGIIWKPYPVWIWRCNNKGANKVIFEVSIELKIKKLKIIKSVRTLMVWMYMWIKLKKRRKQQQNIQEKIDTLKRKGRQRKQGLKTHITGPSEPGAIAPPDFGRNRSKAYSFKIPSITTRPSSYVFSGFPTVL